MTLEVRQLLLKSTISAPDADDEDEQDAGAAKDKPSAGACGASAGDDCEDREQLKEEILAECRVWLLAQLQALRER